jgi:hypothetical protein
MEEDVRVVEGREERTKKEFSLEASLSGQETIARPQT